MTKMRYRIPFVKSWRYWAKSTAWVPQKIFTLQVNLEWNCGRTGILSHVLFMDNIFYMSLPIRNHDIWSARITCHIRRDMTLSTLSVWKIALHSLGQCEPQMIFIPMGYFNMCGRQFFLRPTTLPVPWPHHKPRSC